MPVDTGEGTDSLDMEANSAPTHVSAFRWVVLGILGCIVMLVNADQAAFGVALPSIKSEFHIGNAQAGLFAAMMNFGFAAMQIPAGLAVGRLGARKVMLVGLIVTAIAAVQVGSSVTARDVMTFRCILGLAEASFSLCCVSVINQWFPNRERGTANGLYWGASKLGPVVAPPLAVIVIQELGWRSIFKIFAIPVLVVALLWFLFVHNRPEQSRYGKMPSAGIGGEEALGQAPPATKYEARVPRWLDRAIRLRPVTPIASAGGVFRSWNLIGNAFAGALIVGVFYVFVAWLPSYLVTEKHFDLRTAGLLSSVLFVGTAAGNFTGGWLSDKVLGMRRKPLTLFGPLLSSIALIILCYSPADKALVGVLLLLTGFVIGLGYAQFFVYPMAVTTAETYPVAFAVLNIGCITAAGLFPLLTGFVLDASGWTVAFFMLAGAAAFSFVLVATIDEPMLTKPCG